MQNYSLLNKILHQVVLGNKFMFKNLYDIEKLFFLDNDYNTIIDNKHVFITGLPRSGSTSILNYLYNSKLFASLKYKHMPFIMSPNINKIITFNKTTIATKKERYHGDKIFFNIESPEAFDEAFFSKYVDDEILLELPKYVKLILKREKKFRYLSKNNYNYKRIHLIQQIFKNSIFIIPFRNPISQSLSLLNQHKNFVNLQNQNHFIKKYMNFLGHHDFGNDHISWNQPQEFFDYNNINYWLEQWLLFYTNMLDKFFKNNSCLFIKYESLYEEEYISKLKIKCSLNDNLKNIFINKNYITKKKYDKNLYKKCIDLYKTLSVNKDNI